MRRLAVPRPSRRVCNKVAHVHQRVVFRCACLPIVYLGLLTVMFG